jgi:carboxyl-terminal processing protease
MLATGIVSGQQHETIGRVQTTINDISIRNKVNPEFLQNKTSSEYTDQFDKVWNLVKERFYNANFNGLDWKKIGEKYRTRLSEIKTAAEFEDLMNKMLAELHASHTAYFSSDDIEYYMLPSVLRGDLQGHQVEHIGIMGTQAKKEYIVAAVLEGGPAEMAGILSGDRLLTADGLPFTSAGSFRGKEGRQVRIELRREGETVPRTVMVTPIRQNIIRSFLNATEKSAKIITVGGKKIGYLHLWTMANEAFKTMLEQVVTTKLYNTEGLILDLRDGYGGTPFGYGDVFFRPDVSLEQQSQGRPAYTRHLGYGKPIVVLINQGTRSAKEFLSYQFKVSQRAKLVGTRTAGAFLGASAFEVGKDGLLELAVLGLKVDGKYLEEVGVAPDVTVPSQYAYTERDSQQLAAQQLLLEMLKNGPARSNPLTNNGQVTHQTGLMDKLPTKVR